MTGRLAGKVTVITGAARGQGRSHTLRFAEEGADVVLLDHCTQVDSVPYALATPADLEETVNLVEKHGHGVLAVEADVRDLAALESARDAALERFGRVDVLWPTRASAASDRCWRSPSSSGRTSSTSISPACGRPPGRSSRRWWPAARVGLSS